MAKQYHNIERSAFRHREYIAWDKEGNRYRVRKDGPRKDQGSWWVYPDSPRGLPCFYAGTLALVSLRLARMSAICAMPRLPHER
jgi:hypothetical protein